MDLGLGYKQGNLVLVAFVLLAFGSVSAKPQCLQHHQRLLAVVG